MTVSREVLKLAKLSPETDVKVVKKYEALFLQAVERGQTDDIRALLKLGVDPNCTSPDDHQTALHFVAQRGDLATLDVLFSTKKLDLNARHAKTTPPLISAIKASRVSFVVAMVERGADVNVKDRYNLTPLHHAVYLESTTMLHVLLTRPCNMDAMDKFYNTPLSLAAIDVGTSLEVVELLVMRGADVNFSRGIYVMPLLLLVCLHCTNPMRLSIAMYLLEAGIDPTVEDGRTMRNALHIVAIGNNVPLARELLKRGTSPVQRDICKLAPYQIAERQQNPEVAELLTFAYQMSPDLKGRSTSEIRLSDIIDERLKEDD